jgi:hypothetical protein
MPRGDAEAFRQVVLSGIEALGEQSILDVPVNSCSETVYGMARHEGNCDVQRQTEE